MAQAENGLQGLKQLKANPYELVLLDFLMPVMDGLDVASKFREWEREHRPDFHQVSVGATWLPEGNSKTGLCLTGITHTPTHPKRLSPQDKGFDSFLLWVWV